MDDYGSSRREPMQRGFWGALAQERRWRFLDSMEDALGSFGPAERLVLYLLAGLLGISTLVLVFGVNTLATVTVPSRGGTLLEGEIGSARFINPLLALSQPDHDITMLAYSGLMRAKPDGTHIPDLAESYAISDDGRTYTFKLRKGSTFHDGKKVTAADVIFTIEEAVDPAINSPRRADWTGVSVASPDDETIVFTLPHAYAPFLQNTTLGILPKHLWENVSAEEFPFSSLNTHPVGSGPYKVGRIVTDATGAAARYELSAFKGYALGTPYLSHISFVFYENTEELMQGLNTHKIDAAAGISPAMLANIKRNDLNIIEVPLPRVFGVFFNQSHSTTLADNSVRRALEVAIDKRQIIDDVLAGRGQVLSGPIPPEILENTSPSVPRSLTSPPPIATSTAKNRMDEVRTILSSAGWTLESAQSVAASSSPGGVWVKKSGTGASASSKTLSFTLATADSAELVATARSLALAWQKVGIGVELQIYPLSELNTNVIRPRSYDALLFGEIVGPELDLYAFWHSSQRNDPGLNLALYANPKTDALLSQARATTNETQRKTLNQQFAALLTKDEPTIFLYAPNFLYIVPDDLQGASLGSLSTPADRYENVHEWYTDSERVWTIFTPLDASSKKI